jgi:predicted acylesterase/phospholipase RssA
MPQPPYEFGLVMAGAISGGAYTAGVVDFLLEALDAWENAKNSHEAVPAHAVKIRVMTGASAGAMTTALTGLACFSDVTPVKDLKNPPDRKRNRLYDSWVRQVDISHLLENRDLGNSGGVRSLLDATTLREIAEAALDLAPAKARPYVDDPLAVYFTVTNLRGVPYGFRLFGSDKSTLYGMSSHGDYMAFQLSRTAQKSTLPGSGLLNPNATQGNGWGMFIAAALASGAFPIGLQPVDLRRPGTDYDGRLSRNPEWHPTPEPYPFLCVDGGVIDNEPLELARRYLAGDVAGGTKQNPRNGEDAIRSVIMIDPFPNKVEYDGKWKSDPRLTRVAPALLSALKNQARFKPEELALAEDETIFSRFMIAPSRDGAVGDADPPAMAAAILGGFGGFLHESFRRHDFQLGRRNCQAFLRWHYCLPETNPIHADTAEEIRQRFHVKDRTPGGGSQTALFRTESGRDVRYLPIIPLTGTAAAEVPLPERARGDAVDRDELSGQVLRRLRKVGYGLIDNDLPPIAGALVRFIIKAGWRLHLSRQVAGKAMEAIERELRRLDVTPT